MIKPDITERNLTGEVNSILEKAGLKIVAQKMVRLDEHTARSFYAEHSHRSFFQELIEYITSGPVIVQVLYGENATIKNREIMGATNPKDAANNTIRKIYGISIEKNAIHGSDSVESALREIGFFFAKCDIQNLVG